MKKINVELKFSKKEIIRVGALACDGPRIYFEYDKQFLNAPFEISPFMLSKKSGVLSLASPNHLQGLWGVFHDSLPDAWGQLLMDRYYRSKRINLEDVSLLDRLLFIGEKAAGCLSYQPALETKKDQDLVDLDYMSSESQKIMSGSKDDIIPELLRMGGSPGGARPKIFVGLNHENEIISGAQDLPHDYEHWIIKFNAKTDMKDSGAIEFVYAQMASIAGIKMSETKLIMTHNGQRFFATKRFDRDLNNRFHLHTFANLIGADFRIPSTDYLDLMKASYQLTKSHEDLEKILRLMIFNIMTYNRDDHAKNFSFIMNHQGEWTFAPAYDLTFSEGPGGEHSNTIFGEGKNPTIDHIYKMAEEFSISKTIVREIVDQIDYAISQWDYLCSDVEVTRKLVTQIKNKFLRF